jgi:hypothetical protein
LAKNWYIGYGIFIMDRAHLVVKNSELQDVVLTDPVVSGIYSFEDEEGNTYVSYLVSFEVVKDGKVIGIIMDRNTTIANGFWWNK